MKRQDLTRRILLYLAVAASGFLLAYIFVAFVIIPDEVVAEDVTIPSVVGLTQSDAERRLIALGLKTSLGEARFSGDAPKSTVLSQNPPAGTAAAVGTTVSLDVSAGQQRSTIPALEGLTQDDAERALKGAGLVIGQVAEQPSDSARGKVLESRPTSGQVVPLGTRVDLVVSAGPAELTMPDVVGRDVESARGLLQQVGLVAAPLEYDSLTSQPLNTIVAQSPAAGSAVAAGATVTLRVSGKP